MTRWMEPSEDQIAGWRTWIEANPEVAEAAAKLDPWTLYRMKSTGQRVTIVAIAEPEEAGGPCTVRVRVSGRFNLLATFERDVFGVAIDDLEGCDLPGPHEALGVVGVLDLEGR